SASGLAGSPAFATSPTRYPPAGRRSPPRLTSYSESRVALALHLSSRTPPPLILSRGSVLLGIRGAMERRPFAVASPSLTCCRCRDTFSVRPGRRFSSRVLLPTRPLRRSPGRWAFCPPIQMELPIQRVRIRTSSDDKVKRDVRRPWGLASSPPRLLN